MLFADLPRDCIHKVYLSCDGVTRSSLLTAVPRAPFRCLFTSARTTGICSFRISPFRFGGLRQVTVHPEWRDVQEWLKVRRILAVNREYVTAVMSAASYWSWTRGELSFSDIELVRIEGVRGVRCGPEACLERFVGLDSVCLNYGSHSCSDVPRVISTMSLSKLLLTFTPHGGRLPHRKTLLFPTAVACCVVQLTNVSLDFADATDPFASMPHITKLSLNNSDLAGWPLEDLLQLASTTRLAAFDVCGHLSRRDFDRLELTPDVHQTGFYHPASLYVDVTMRF